MLLAAEHRQAWYIGGVSFISVIASLSIIICSISLHQLCIKNTELVAPLYRKLTIICIVVYTTNINTDLVRLIIRWQNFPDRLNSDREELAVLTTSSGIYFLGNIIFYILLLARIYKTFKLSRWLIITLFAIIVICFSLSTAYCVITFYYNFRKEFFNAFYLTQIKYTVYPLCIAAVTLDISFFVIFNDF